jgi:hypothetical protein
MRRVPINPGDRGDPELQHVQDWFSARGTLSESFGTAVRTALDEVIDTARTGRWSLDQCGDQEKAYVGVKVENVVRGAYLLGRGAHGMDYDVDGVDVDCKWTKNFGGWQIPREAVGHICLLIWAQDERSELAVGLIRIRENILVGGNQDQKKTIQSPEGRREIRWLVQRAPVLPPNFLLQLPPDDRDAILAHKGGDARARELFKRCDGIIIHRHTIESIGQQIDESRRFRGETRAALRAEGFEVLNGHRKDQRARAEELGGPVPVGSAQWVCLRTDGASRSRREQGRSAANATLF